MPPGCASCPIAHAASPKQLATRAVRPSGNAVQLGRSPSTRRAWAAMALEDMDAVTLRSGGLSAPGAERIATHLAFDAARDAAAAARAHPLRAQLVEDALPRLRLARLVLRGEWPRYAAASGG